MSFDKAVVHVIDIEGEYVNDPMDSGGEKKFGLTRRIAQSNGYYGPLIEMTYQDAVRVCKRAFWDRLMLDEVELLSQALAEELFETAYWCGPARASQWLQRSLNALNREGADYFPVSVDGDLGSQTLSSLSVYMRLRGPQGGIVLLRALNVLQGAYNIELAERRVKDERFLFGWILNHIVV